ncbi:LLM class flavin-dependent oxidoreductase [Sphingorhabdus sp.]|jgi:alkanesulfonate monooxygenase SsuD/methylene tetrahydromethanopterin reductase-like flavin-dependent oxidoreductase (luciferase family)|uniref:LLM class flavin-dependent oxidoreductase n=1 Tax=Sphingorhabdus sp. TaxID=1902408 RepID=UPI0037C61643
MRFAHFSHVWTKPGMTPHERYEQLWREIELCDELDYDFAFSVEHHFTPKESWMSSPNLFSVAAAARTKRIKLGAMGHVVPLHHPVRLLEEVALADQISNGRIEVGLVPGIQDSYFRNFAANFQDRRAITEEFARFMHAAYSEGGPDRPFSWDGECIKATDLELSVWPVQKPGPPMWMQSRDPPTLELCAELGMHTGYFLLFPRSEAASRYGPYLENWKRHGQSGTPNIAYSTVTFVDETDEIALSKARVDAGNAYKGFFSSSDDWDEIRAKQKETAAYFEMRGDHGAGQIILNLLDPDYLLEKDLVLIGSPETVTNKLRRWSQDGLFNTFFGEFNFGSIPEEALMRSIRLFGEHVIPNLRDHEPF